MEVSVSIVNYKVPELLASCIESLQVALQHISSEIIVVDNASEDDSKTLIKSRFPEVTWIQNEKNVGFGRAHNQAIRQAKGTYIAIVNPDVVVSRNTFKKLSEFMHTTENVGIIGVQMRNEDKDFLPESKRNPPTLWNAFQKELGLNFLPKNKNYYALQVNPNEVAPVPVLSGAFMYMERSKFNALGGFDERYFMYAEDIDLSIESLKMGWDNYYLGNIIITHLKGKSAKKNPESQHHFYHTMKQYIDKHQKNPSSRWWYKRFIDLAALKSKILN